MVSMVVHELDVLGAAIAPSKADAELIVHTDRPLTFAVADQLVQPVAAECAQITQRCGCIDGLEATTRHRDQICREAFAGIAALEDRLRLLRPPRLDHWRKL